MRNTEPVLGPLPSLSFSRYLLLKKCLLRGAAIAHANPLRAVRPPRLRSQVLGDILHEAMSGINGIVGASLSQVAFRAQFNRVVRDAYTKIAASPSSRHLGDPHDWPELVDVYYRLADVVEMRRTGAWGLGVDTCAERKLTSRDGLLWGQVDAYFMSKDGIDLVDYKSGAVLEGDAPKQDYESQLYFYAYLIHETHSVYPRSLGLVGRDGLVVSLPPSPDRSSALAAEMRSLLAQYNDVVSRSQLPEELATPSSESCLFCERKAICERFWATLPLLDTPAWNHVAIGVQSTPLMRTPRGGGWFELAVEQSSLSVQTVKVTRIFEQRFPAVDLEHRVGQRLLITGLRESRTMNPPVAEATERCGIVHMGSHLERR